MSRLLWSSSCLLLVVFVSLVSVTPGAGQAHLWCYGYGSTGSDKPHGVAIDTADNNLVTGEFAGTVDFGGGPHVSGGGTDIFVAKYDASGAWVWSATFGGSGDDAGEGICVDAADNVYVVGWFESASVDFGGGAHVNAGAGADIFITKFDANGVHQWSQHFGNPGAEKALDVCTDASDNVIMTGWFPGTISFGGAAHTASVYDAFLAKYDPAGNYIWSKAFGAGGTDRGRAVCTDADNNVYLTGVNQGSPDFGGGPIPNNGVFLVKRDSSGGHVWSKGFGGANYLGPDRGDVCVDGAGNVIVTGQFNGTVDFGAGNVASTAGTYDIFLAKYGSAGTHLWSQTFGSNGGGEGGMAVATDADNNIFLGAKFANTVDFGDGDLLTSGIFSDIALVKYDPSGLYLWGLGLGGGSDDYPDGLGVDSADNPVLVAHFSGVAGFGGVSLTGAGSFDVAVAKYEGSQTSTGVADDRLPSMTTLAQNRPNPFNPNTTIQVILTEPASLVLEIYDVHGAMVRRLDGGVRNAGTHHLEWDGKSHSGEDLASGVYFYLLAGYGDVQAKKMLLLK